MPPPVRPRTLSLLLAALGGLVTEAAFPDRGLWFLAPFGIALLFLALRDAGAGRAALAAFVWGLAFFAPHLHWAYVSVGAVPWVAIVLTEAALTATFGAAWACARRWPPARDRAPVAVVVFAASWVTVEQIRSLFPFGGFPWGRLAFSQADAPTAALAAVLGAPGVSGAVATSGALLGLAAASAAVRPRRALGLAASAALPVALGWALPLPPAEPAGADGLRVAAVQGNVARPGLDAFSHRLEVLRNHVAGTLRAVEATGEGLDLVLWPENAADIDPRADLRARELVETAAQAAGAPVLVGTQRYDEFGRYNDSVLWSPGEGPIDLYTKQHPAPYGEYIPMRSFSRLFSDKVDLISTDMLPGTELGVVDVPVPRLGRTVPIADVICFEVAYDPLVRDAVAAGGEVIVVQTNNASFGRTPESTQQLAMTRLRAVEHGRTAVQISTVGVSAVVAPDGTVIARTGLFTADEMLATLPLRTRPTLATRLADFPAWAAAGLAGSAVALGLATAGRRGRLRPAVTAPSESLVEP